METGRGRRKRPLPAPPNPRPYRHPATLSRSLSSNLYSSRSIRRYSRACSPRGSYWFVACGCLGAEPRGHAAFGSLSSQQEIGNHGRWTKEDLRGYHDANTGTDGGRDDQRSGSWHQCPKDTDNYKGSNNAPFAKSLVGRYDEETVH